MSTRPVVDNPPSASKSKKNKKKKARQKDAATDVVNTQAAISEQDGDQEDDEHDEEPTSPQKDDEDTHQNTTPSAHAASHEDAGEQHGANAIDFGLTNGLGMRTEVPSIRGADDGPEERLEAAAQERDRLKAEVTELRKSLEDLRQKHLNGTPHEVQGGSGESADEKGRLRSEVSELRQSLENMQQRHDDELASVRERLEQTQTGKEHAETRYQKLLGQVNTIKTQLGERLKADAEELSQARTHIEELEDQNRTVLTENASLQSQISKVSSDREQGGKETSDLRDEVAELRGRINMSQKNWAKERDDLLSREAQLREEFETARQAMQDWEVLAMEERSIREGMSDRIAEFEEQLSNQREAYDRAASERDSQSLTVDGLQRALQEIQDARKQELREIVENTQTQLEELRAQLKTAEESASSAQTALETTREELEHALPFEKEVKEKNLLIGKLRHEAVILNDHLTKALRFLKKGKPQDNVDRQLVTNHLLHFLALDRSDPKKFQVLQLISALLSWTEEQNEAAGLARPGGSSQTINLAQQSSLRVPFTPFRRVSSSNSLNSPRSPSASMNLNNIFNSPNAPSFDPNAMDSTLGHRSDSLADLWSSFLEREAQEGVSTSSGRGHSRRTSLNSNAGGSIPRNSERKKETSIREDGGEV